MEYTEIPMPPRNTRTLVSRARSPVFVTYKAAVTCTEIRQYPAGKKSVTIDFLEGGNIEPELGVLARKRLRFWFPTHTFAYNGGNLWFAFNVEDKMQLPFLPNIYANFSVCLGEECCPKNFDEAIDLFWETAFWEDEQWFWDGLQFPFTDTFNCRSPQECFEKLAELDEAGVMKLLNHHAFKPYRKTFEQFVHCLPP
jgi:hypothetical protein